MVTVSIIALVATCAVGAICHKSRTPKNNDAELGLEHVGRLPNIERDDNQFAILVNKNFVYFFNAKTREQIGHGLQIADPKYYYVADIDFAPNGHLYASVSVKPKEQSSSKKKITAHIAIINPNEEKIVAKIQSEALPEQMTFDNQGNAYIVHSFEYKDGSGWAISILDSETNEIQTVKNLPGSPRKPRLLNDGQVYIPIMHGSGGNEGNNVAIVYPDFSSSIDLLITKKIADVYPADIAYDPPSESYWMPFIGDYNEQNDVKISKETVYPKGNTVLVIYNKIKDDSKYLVTPRHSNPKLLIHRNYVLMIYSDSTGDPLTEKGGIVIIDKKTGDLIDDVDTHDQYLFAAKDAIIINNEIFVTRPGNEDIQIFSLSSFKNINTINLQGNPTIITN